MIKVHAYYNLITEFPIVEYHKYYDYNYGGGWPFTGGKPLNSKGGIGLHLSDPQCHHDLIFTVIPLGVNREISWLRFRTDKEVYLLGEKVIFILENLRDKPIYLAGYRVLDIEDRWGFKYFSFCSASRLTAIEPRSMIIWIWNQTNYKCEQAKPELYVAYLRYVIVGPLDWRILTVNFKLSKNHWKVKWMNHI